jgi:hypothetical protein
MGIGGTAADRQWKPYTGMTDDEEEAYIRKAVEAYQSTSPTGKVPVGVSTGLDPAWRVAGMQRLPTLTV